MKDFFSDKPYPGRFIIVGKDAGSYVIIYGATGRSESSLKRHFVELEDGVYMTAVDATVALHGNPDLLEYPAIRFFDAGMAVANGNHIERLDPLQNRNARQQLSYALNQEAYEPDEHRTPRITACIVESDVPSAALHIIRSASNGIDRSVWDVELENGNGYYIATYTGADIKPTPSFAGGPLPIPLAFGTPEKAAETLLAALAPEEGKGDYRVGCIAVYKKPGIEHETIILNAHSV